MSGKYPAVQKSTFIVAARSGPGSSWWSAALDGGSCGCAKPLVRHHHLLEQMRLAAMLGGGPNQRPHVLGQALSPVAAVVWEHERVAPADPRVKEPQFPQLLVVNLYGRGDVVQLVAERDLHGQEG